jgi:hypothetical protein
MSNIILFKEDKDAEYTKRLIDTFKLALADFSALVIPDSNGVQKPIEEWFPVFKKWATEPCVCAMAGVPSNKLKRLCRFNGELDELYAMWKDARDFVCMQQQDFLPERTWQFLARSLMKLSESAPAPETAETEANTLRGLPDEVLKERLKEMMKNRILD